MPKIPSTADLPRVLACLSLSLAALDLSAQLPEKTLDSPAGLPGLNEFPTVKVKSAACYASSRGVVTFSNGPNVTNPPIRGVMSTDALVVKTGAAAFLTLSLSNGMVIKLGENSSLRFDEFLQQDLTPDNTRPEEAFSSRLRLYLEEGSIYFTGPKLRSSSIVLITTPMGLAHIEGRQAYLEVRLRPGSTNEVDVLSNEGLIFVHPESLQRAPETIKQGSDNLCELRQSTSLSPVTTTIRTQTPDFLKGCREQFLRMEFASSRLIWSKLPAAPGKPAELKVTPNVPASLLAIEPVVRYSP